MGSLIDRYYSTGRFYEQHDRDNRDGQFKANCFIKLALPFVQHADLEIQSYADVGCGNGEAAKIIADSLRQNGYDLKIAKGYDISPHVEEIHYEGVEYVYADFCETDEFIDLVTLF